MICHTPSWAALSPSPDTTPPITAITASSHIQQVVAITFAATGADEVDQNAITNPTSTPSTA